MKRYLSISTIAVLTGLIMMLAAIPATGQSLEETLNSLSEIAGKEYVRPLVNGFGANLNSGWFHKAPNASIFGIDLEIGLVAMGAFLKDENKTFSTTGDFTFSYDQAYVLAQGTGQTNSTILDGIADAIAAQTHNVVISGATAIGAEDNNVIVSFSGNNVSYGGYTVPDQDVDLGVGGILDDASMIPYAAPQFSIGTVYGTQATFRYLPDVEINSDIGKIKYFGFGIQHNPKIWFPADFILPVDLAASFFTQTLEVGNVFEATSTAFGINASKGVSLIGLLGATLYGGLMFESATMDFAYDYEILTQAGLQSNRIEFSVDSENSTRIVLGVALNLLGTNLNIDYNIAKYNSVSAGLFFGF
ncbi:DUF6588 family protein [candidate division KSB1 bacterium]